jgi:hypothetical protein
VDLRGPAGVSERRCVRDRARAALGHHSVRKAAGCGANHCGERYDLLRRLGYPGYNFETHTPTYFRRRWVFEAYCEFRDFVTEDRWYGMLGPTAILSHAYRHTRCRWCTWRPRAREPVFRGKPPADLQTVVEACRGTAFLNFDDEAFGPVLHRYLAQEFPAPSRYERPDEGDGPAVSIARRMTSWIACITRREAWPATVRIPGRNDRK